MRLLRQPIAILVGLTCALEACQPIGVLLPSDSTDAGDSETTPLDSEQEDTAPTEGRSAMALVLVDSSSADHAHFAGYVQPYLDNFGLPYRTLDVASEELVLDDAALCVVGHRGVDPGGTLISAEESQAVVEAVQAGAGLVVFDDQPSEGRLAFVQELFGFAYGTSTTGSDVVFTSGGETLDCWDDEHQDPVLATTTDATELDTTDGQWTEFHWEAGDRPFPAVFAGVDEVDLGLPVMRFFADGLEPGTYELYANLYSSSGLRYYYGFEQDEPTAHSVDLAAGSGGEDQHEEVSLGTVEITDGSFELYVQDADITSGTYPYFGWAWLRLAPEGDDESHYVTGLHASADTVSTGSMELAGLEDPGQAQVLASVGGAPFLAVVEAGEGRAVQWGSTAWMSHAVKGPVYGLDDLVWRSLVWAARKPFPLQHLPPVVTMRVDDATGPFDWVEEAHGHGMVPWVGFFVDDIDEEEAAHLSALVADGHATASLHAYTSTDFFYFDHAAGTQRSGEAVAASFEEATAWLETHDIPSSNYVVPHYYEIGRNCFDGLSGWGVEFLGIQMEPGSPYSGSSWIVGGPYRAYESPGTASESRPLAYAHPLSLPDLPEHDGAFFNLVTEVRDDAGYEWYPSSDVDLTVGRGVRQTVRALDSKVLATLFTHATYIHSTGSTAWAESLEEIVAQLEPWDPIYLSQDQASLLVRALHRSAIRDARWDPGSEILSVELEGEADVETSIFVYTEEGGEVLVEELSVPAFDGAHPQNAYFTSAKPRR